GDVAELSVGLPRGRTAEAAEPRVVGMLAAMRRVGAGSGLGPGDGQRSVAAIRMAHHPDALALDVRPEAAVFENRIDDAGPLPRAAHPHAGTGYVVALSSGMRGCRDDVALRGERYREISVEQRHAAGPMRDDDHPELPCRQWRVLGHRHLERHPSTQDR